MGKSWKKNIDKMGILVAIGQGRDSDEMADVSFVQEWTHQLCFSFQKMHLQQLKEGIDDCQTSSTLLKLPDRGRTVGILRQLVQLEHHM